MSGGSSEHSKLRDGRKQQAGSAEIPEAASSGSSRVLLLAIVFLCVVAAGVSAAVLSSPGGSQAGYIAGSVPSGGGSGQVADTGSRPAATKTRSAQPTATETRAAQPTLRASNRAVIGAEVTKKGVAQSALRWPPQLQRQMLRWWGGSGGAALTTVETQMGNTMQAAGLKLYVSMRSACTSLASAIATAQARPPIPYDAMQRLYRKVLSGLSRAAADCRTAISEHPGDETIDVHLNHGLLNLSRAEFAAMSSKLYTATAEIQALGR